MTDFWYLISHLWIGTFFYGIYLVLFCICIYILLHRPHNRANNVLLVTAVALFTLSTIQTVLNIVLGASDIDGINIPYDNILLAKSMLYAVNNVIADGLVIYRCYVIWSYNIYVIIVPIVMLVVTSVFAFDLQLPLAPFFVTTLATNLFVTALTAGRIWWICRQASGHLKAGGDKRSATSISIIVESGAIYSLAVLMYLVLGAIPSTVVAQQPSVEMLTQVVGIVPTLVIVRVGLGLSVQNVHSSIASATVLDSEASMRNHHVLGSVGAIRSGRFDPEKGLPPIASQSSGRF
ncbi:hypothetical protein C8F04DRAFT_1111439 [Mycena alexandri]|uniref:Uncharacterized protein n=1 Tax=Mycena alexandri TaxID=1745969 RepID=A0AAD6SPF3_9AGAR|nr:hypothetical protein C8F04DRAFT_1111439 [Mycena alexandri]